jgi:cephalosporin hydroxylase
LWTYDTQDHCKSARAVIKEYIPSTINFQYKIGDTRRGEEIDVDFTFLDNVHNGTWVYNELRAHAPSVKYYIAVHDTLLQDRGMPEKLDSKKDIVWHGVTKFLEQDSDWEIYKHVTEGSGIVVLKRVGWQNRRVMT